MSQCPLLIDLLGEMTKAWRKLYDFEDLQMDEEKVELLLAARSELLRRGVVVPEEIRDFYYGVFQSEQFSSAPKGEA